MNELSRGRLDDALTAIDSANAADPAFLVHEGRSVTRSQLYGWRMSQKLHEFCARPSEHLQIAARAQHIERWLIPRTSYPEGRIGYLSWRKDLQKHHAQRTGDIMRLAGYGEADVARVSALLRKERLKHDPEVQMLEDVVCLVFLAHEADEFIAKHDDDKVRDILAKTSRKMSKEGLLAAGRLELSPRLTKLLGEALSSDQQNRIGAFSRERLVPPA